MVAIFSRYNVRHERPCQRVNFVDICDAEDPDSARLLLEQVLAFVAPVLEDHNLTLNRVTDAPYNDIWGGQNHAKGESVEVVLRQRNGRFKPFGVVVGTILHEAAHNKYYTHGVRFKAVFNKLYNQAVQLAVEGWTGAGRWGCGQTLAGEIVQPDKSTGYNCSARFIFHSAFPRQVARLRSFLAALFIFVRASTCRKA
ncbi:hypothetical protein JCM10296v2_002923 [Rhodotorula toruloides]